MITFLLRVNDIEKWLKKNIYYFDGDGILQMLPLSVRSNININVALYYKFESLSFKEKIKYRDKVIECDVKNKSRVKKR